MDWIVITLASYFLWALVNVGDKYVISRKLKSAYIYLILSFGIGILSLLIIPFIDFVIPNIAIFGLLILGGLLYFFGSLPYFLAVKIEEISRINILWNLIPVFTLVIAWFTLGEQLNLRQLLSFVILIAAAVTASVHFKKKNIVFSKGFYLMVVSCLAYAGYVVILRFVLLELPFISVFIWTSLITFCLACGMFIFKKIRTEFKDDLINIDRKLILTILSIAIVDSLAILFNTWALSIAVAAALVYVFDSAQSLFVFLIAILLTIFYPRIIKEEIDKANIFLKILSLILIIIGIILLNI